MYSFHIKAFQNFHDEHLLSNVRQLLTLLSSKPNEQLNVATTFFIRDWFWLNGKRVIIPFREAPLIDYIFLNAASIVIFYLVFPIIFPRTLIIRVLNAALRTFAKFTLYVSCNLNLPNVSRIVCVVRYILRKLANCILRWDVSLNDSKWIISRTIKLLRQLPRLSELFLVMDEALEEFDHLVNCVSKLHNLRKLGFRFYHDFPERHLYYLYSDRNFNLPRINATGKIIAANSSLTHLEMTHSQHMVKNIDLAQILAYVPVDYPLKLEHICLSHSFRNLATLAPHIRSLTSIGLGDSRVLNELLRHSIFPPTVTLQEIDRDAIEYLQHHPQLISLTTWHPCHESFCSTILRILSRHSKTLTNLGIFFHILYQCIDQTQNELALLQCTNLKQMVLYCYELEYSIDKQMVGLARSLDSCHILNAISTGDIIVGNCAPSGLTYAGGQSNLGLRIVDQVL